MSRTQPASEAGAPAAPRPVSPGYYRPTKYVPNDNAQVLAVAEEKLRFLQDEERRNRTRTKLLEEEVVAKQMKVKDLTAQQDERRAHLRALDEEIIKKQQAITRLTLEADNRNRGIVPLDEEYTNKKQAVDALQTKQEEMRRQLRELEEEMLLKQRALVALGDQTTEVAEKQKAVADLLLQQKKLQEEVEAQRRQVQDKMARSATTEAHNEVVLVNIERQQGQLKCLEQELQQKKTTLDNVRELVEVAEKQQTELQNKAMVVERDIAKKKAELQTVDEDLGLKKKMLQELMLQHAKVQADADAEKRRLKNYKATEDIQTENTELKEQVNFLKQELTRVKLELEDKTYKVQSLETMMQVQRQRQDATPMATGSHMTVASNPEQRSQLVNIMRRQEDRITRQQQELAEKEMLLKKAEARAQQEQELREMVENELGVALAELQMEKGKVAMLQRTCDVQDIRVSALEGELEKIRQDELLMLMDGDPALTTHAPPMDGPEPSIPDVSASIRRQQDLIAQIQQQQGADHGDRGALPH